MPVTPQRPALAVRLGAALARGVTAAACLAAGAPFASSAALGAEAAALAEPGWQRQLQAQGLNVQVQLLPEPGQRLRPGAPAWLRVTLTQALSGEPLAGVLPGVWLDAAAASGPAGAASSSVSASAAQDAASCERRVARYARASGVNPQALVDVNGYDVLALNADASISVLDPRTQFAGSTSLRATVSLPGAGFDWAGAADERALWLSVPSVNALVRADLALLKVSHRVALPGAPARVRLAPSGKQVWTGVAQGAAPGQAGGVAVVQAQPPHRLQWLELGRGHVEMAFDPSGWVAVTQRESAEVVFIDPTTLTVVHRAALTPNSMPLNVVFDNKWQRFIVAEARSGALWAFGPRGQPLSQLALAPGIGPLTLTPDGRWLLAANPARQEVVVVDLAAWRVAHRVPVSGRPYDVGLTPGYAYVRALDSEAVTLIALPSLATAPRAQTIAMGERPPGRTPHLPLASQMAPMLDGSGSFVVSPGDNSVYFYMEGMNAPAGSVSARGHEVRAVRVARRGLQEIAPGVYEHRIELPAAPQLVLAVATESPRARLCLEVALQEAAPAPAAAPWQLVYEQMPDRASTLALQVTGTAAGQLPGALRVRLFQPGGPPLELLALAQPQGRYIAQVPENLATGLWYVHPQVPRGSGAVWSYASFVRGPRQP